MKIALDEKQSALREELRVYFARLVDDELIEEISVGEGGGPLYRKALEQMGTDGWIGIGWPREYGGQERSPLDQFLFADECQRAGFPLPFLTINSVGPTIMEYGTDSQKKDYLPRITAGKIHFAIGYSEADAGTDLASLKTSAVRDGDEWVINGQKMWTSLADYSEYVWLAARTDPDAEKHAGISIFIVDVRSPGFSITPIETIGKIKTNVTYYDNVRVPADALVGEPGMGWTLIVNQLNHERVSLFTSGTPERIYLETLEWARSTRRPSGGRVVDVPWVQSTLARVKCRVDVLKLFNWRQAWNMGQGTFRFDEASTVKVYGSESYIQIYRDLLQVTGLTGSLPAGSPGFIIRGRLERMYRAMLILTFGGGTNEVQRDIIAMAGLGMPRSMR
jgi:alkylation response protein AidB-like acyl-CoA dehydrogenase